MLQNVYQVAVQEQNILQLLHGETCIHVTNLLVGLRKAEQEMDSLSFRNQQLAKRVELLQEELLTSEAKGKKSKVSLAESLNKGNA